MITIKWPAIHSLEPCTDNGPPSPSLWRTTALETRAVDRVPSEGWSLWSDSHLRIRVYKTRPVAAEAQRQRNLRFLIFDLRLENGALTWICTTNFRLRRAACRTNYTLRAI